MNKFWYDHIKEKNHKKAKLCYIHTESFIYTKTDDLIWKKGLIHIPLAMERNQIFFDMMKNGLGGQIMKEIFCLKPKMYSNKNYYHEKRKKPRVHKNVIEC